MSYAQRKEISGNRTVAIVLVVVIQFIIGYAIITGLAYNVLKKAATDLKTFNVEEQPPPPPKDMPKVPPPPMVPPPLVQTNTPPPPTIAVVQSTVVPPQPPIIAPVSQAAPPAPPPPPPPRQVQPKSLTGSLQGLYGSDDYPPSAADNNETGTVTVQLTVGPNGRVVACNASGGTSTLRDATCRIAKARARYSPAQDANGNPTTSTTSGSVTWRLE